MEVIDLVNQIFLPETVLILVGTVVLNVSDVEGWGLTVGIEHGVLNLNLDVCIVD